MNPLNTLPLLNIYFNIILSSRFRSGFFILVFSDQNIVRVPHLCVAEGPRVVTFELLTGGGVSFFQRSYQAPKKNLDQRVGCLREVSLVLHGTIWWS
jgi:hypothetical protein